MLYKICVVFLLLCIMVELNDFKINGSGPRR